jgi:hypothetical protein
MRRAPVLLMALILLAALSGCKHAQRLTEYVAERAVIRAPELIAPADSYHAEASGRTKKGVDLVRITGTNVRPDTQQVFDPFVLSLTHVQVATNTRRVTRIAETTFSARINEQVVGTIIRERARGNEKVKDLHVAFTPGVITISATVSVTNWLNVPVSVIGVPRSEDGVTVILDAKTWKVGPVGVPQSVVQSTVSPLLNPLVDLSTLRCTPRGEYFSVENGTLTVSGHAVLKGELN